MMDFKGLTKYYGTSMVLDIPEITFEEDSCTAILGTNGSGKSTFLKLLAEELCGQRKSVRERAGYLPQQAYGFHCSVQKNIELAIWEEDPVQRRKRAAEAMELVNIENLAKKSGNMLSGGETQRMALARLLVQGNRILLLDEPTSACDIAGNNQIEQVLDSWKGTVIFSTHSPAQAARLADRVIFLHRGKIAEDGPAEKLLFTPVSQELKGFLKYWRF